MDRSFAFAHGEVTCFLRHRQTTSVITEDGLERLPPLVARYLRVAGVVGQPRVRNMHVRFHGQIRGAPDEPWMSFTGEQFNVFDDPSRFFFMRAKRGPVPVQVLHRYRHVRATMRVRVVGLVGVTDAYGPEMDRAETVTVFNDMCLLAPASLVDAPVEWTTPDDRRVLATFTNGAQRVTATLIFDADGRLVNFVSDDRYMSTPDGRFERARWSTPVAPYTRFGSAWLMSGGEGWWHATHGDFVYIRFFIDSVTYNVASR